MSMWRSEIDEGAAVLSDVCALLADDRPDRAAGTLQTRYPFKPIASTSRRYSALHCTRVFARDGFLDRYSGKRLVFPGTLRLLAKLLPGHFPFHSNWKTDACHFAFYELFPTIDHVVPVSRGGRDDDSNWVATSMLLNSAKANFTLDELGWRLHPEGDIGQWDGLAGWFLQTVDRSPSLLSDRYLKHWHAAARAVLVPHSPHI